MTFLVVTKTTFVTVYYSLRQSHITKLFFMFYLANYWQAFCVKKNKEYCIILVSLLLTQINDSKKRGTA